MPTIERFEDILAWQRARELNSAIYTLTRTGVFARDFALRDQIRRASISVLPNIAEGFKRGGTAEFIQFLSIAKGSAGEVQAQLYVAFDQRYVDKPTFQRLQSLAQETARLIGGFMQYLQRSDIRGNKYRTR